MKISNVKISVLGESTYRISYSRGGEHKGSALNRYNIFKEPAAYTNYAESENAIRTPKTELVYDQSGGMLHLKTDGGGTLISAVIDYADTPKGFDAKFKIRADEKIYGLGDVTRDRLNKHGYKTDMWVSDVKSYVPIPFLMAENWGILLNTTFLHYADVGANDIETIRFHADDGDLDYYLFAGESFKDILNLYTDIAGKPVMLPRCAFGLTFVCNMQADAGEFISDALNFRREDIPCDILGLEPGWMEKFYDETTHKKWHPDRFNIPSYAPTGPNTFPSAAGRLGFKMSLWLCCDYDLSYYEEALIGGNTIIPKKESVPYPAGFEADEHFINHKRMTDAVTSPDEPWFEHLKKFVDQGAAAFKMDGAYQVLDHPDRLYANGMHDNEMHNLYPTLLNKQMSKGYADYTGKRAMIYSSGGYTGIQQYSATWAGDTGGGHGPMVSILNHGMSGHSNASCDMEVFSTEGIHFGFLQPWAQLCSWNYWRHPWLLADEDKEIFRQYAKLRYSLLPYFYTAAYEASVSGMPIMRAMPLVYPEYEKADSCLKQYMLGGGLLTAAFNTDTIYLPEGEWFDFWTDDLYEGGKNITYKPPKGKGGALFVKSGTIIPMCGITKFIGEKEIDAYELHIYGSAAEGLIYSDDGVTYAYQNGEYALTAVKAVSANGICKIDIKTKGSYKGMPDKITYKAVIHGGNKNDEIIINI